MKAKFLLALALISVAGAAICGGDGRAPLGAVAASLESALNDLSGFIASGEDIASQDDFDALVAAFADVGTSGASIKLALKVVTSYETKNGGITKSKRDTSTKYAVAQLIQALIDQGFTRENVAKHYENVFGVGAAALETSKYFPGTGSLTNKDRVGSP